MGFHGTDKYIDSYKKGVCLQSFIFIKLLGK